MLHNLSTPTRPLGCSRLQKSIIMNQEKHTYIYDNREGQLYISLCQRRFMKQNAPSGTIRRACIG
jgi:hypothetical protein